MIRCFIGLVVFLGWESPLQAFEYHQKYKVSYCVGLNACSDLGVIERKEHELIPRVNALQVNVYAVREAYAGSSDSEDDDDTPPECSFDDRPGSPVPESNEAIISPPAGWTGDPKTPGGFEEALYHPLDYVEAIKKGSFGFNYEISASHPHNDLVSSEVQVMEDFSEAPHEILYKEFASWLPTAEDAIRSGLGEDVSSDSAVEYTGEGGAAEALKRKHVVGTAVPRYRFQKAAGMKKIMMMTTTDEETQYCLKELVLPFPFRSGKVNANGQPTFRLPIIHLSGDDELPQNYAGTEGQDVVILSKQGFVVPDPELVGESIKTVSRFNTNASLMFIRNKEEKYWKTIKIFFKAHPTHVFPIRVQSGVPKLSETAFKAFAGYFKEDPGLYEARIKELDTNNPVLREIVGKITSRIVKHNRRNIISRSNLPRNRASSKTVAREMIMFEAITARKERRNSLSDTFKKKLRSGLSGSYNSLKISASNLSNLSVQ